MATGIATPYRDPRTAYGRRIPVGEATELAGMPPEFQPPRAAAPAAAPGAAAVEPPTQRAGTLARGGLRALAGPVGIAAAAAPEALDVGRVARNPNATGIDVATQAAEGIGRMAAAGAGAAGGAKLGTLAAPFLGPAAPLAPVVGGIAGGAYGYWAADKAIRGGREAVGVDPRSPVEIPATPATGIAMPLPPGVTPSTAGAGRGSVNPPRADPNAPLPTTEAQDARRLRTDGSNVTIGTVPGYGAEAQAIDARTRAINASMVDTRRALDAYGPGPQGGGMTGIGGGTLSSANNQRFDNTPSLSVLPAAGQSVGQFQALRAAEREGMRTRESAQRGQDLVFQGQQLASGTQRGIADIQANAQRDVAAMAADSRMSAAESNANARAAAAELAARRFIPVAGGQQVVEIGGLPTTVTQPSRVFDQTRGIYVDPPAPRPSGIAGDPRAAAIRDNPKLSDAEKRKQLQALGYS